MNSKFKLKIALASHNIIKANRSTFFGAEDFNIWMPEYQQDDCKVMCPPFVGNNYKKGGMILVGINPGGGKFKSEVKTINDRKLYEKIHTFHQIDTLIEQYYWEEFIPTFLEIKPKLTIFSQHIKLILNCANFSLNDVSYFNILPYRCRNDKYPRAKKDLHIIHKSIKYFFNPLVNLLEPSIIVYLGKKAFEYINDFDHSKQINNTIWDREQAKTDRREQSRNICATKIKNWKQSYLRNNSPTHP